MTRIGVGVVLLLALAGCADPPPPDFKAACTSYGFTPGTDAFAGCVQKETLAYTAQRQAAFSAAMSQIQANRPVSCTTNLGRTTCY